MRPRISIRVSVHPYVRPSVCMSVMPFQKTLIMDWSLAEDHHKRKYDHHNWHQHLHHHPTPWQPLPSPPPTAEDALLAYWPCFSRFEPRPPSGVGLWINCPCSMVSAPALYPPPRGSFPPLPNHMREAGNWPCSLTNAKMTFYHFSLTLQPTHQTTTASTTTATTTRTT